MAVASPDRIRATAFVILRVVRAPVVQDTAEYGTIHTEEQCSPVESQQQ